MSSECYFPQCQHHCIDEPICKLNRCVQNEEMIKFFRYIRSELQEAIFTLRNKQDQ